LEIADLGYLNDLFPEDIKSEAVRTRGIIFTMLYAEFTPESAELIKGDANGLI
jgi:hypothetical protein